MASQTINGINVEIKGDVKGLLEAVKAGKASMADLSTFLEQKLTQSMSRAEKAQDSYNKQISKMANELRGGGATAQLGMLAAAFEKAEQKGKLTATQMENLANKVRSLAAAGGSVPASLQNLTKGVEGLGNAAEKLKGQGLQQLEGMAGRLGPVGSALGAIGPAGLAAAAGIGAMVAAGGGMVKLVTDSAAWAAKIKDTAAVTGLSVEAIQRLEHAAAASGTSFEKVTSAVLKMQQQLQDAPQLFEDIGLSITALKGMSVEDQFVAVANSLASISDAGLRNATALKLVGKSWAELAPLVNGGLDAMRDANVVSNENVDALNELQTESNLLKKSWSDLWNSMGVAVGQSSTIINAIKTITSAMGDLSAKVRGEGLSGLLPFLVAIGGGGSVGYSLMDAMPEQTGPARDKYGRPLSSSPDFSNWGAARRVATPTVESEADRALRRAQEREAAEVRRRASEALAREGAARVREILEQRRSDDALRAAMDPSYGLPGLISDPDQIAASQARYYARTPDSILPINGRGIPNKFGQSSFTSLAGGFGGQEFRFASGFAGSGLAPATDPYTDTEDKLDKINKKIKLNFGSTQEWQSAVQSLAATFQMLGIKGGDSLSQLAAGISSAGQLASSMATGNVPGMVSGGLGTLSSFWEIGRKGGTVGNLVSAVSPVALLGNLFGSDGPAQRKGADTGFGSVNTLLDQLNDGFQRNNMSALEMRDSFDAAFSELKPGLIDQTTGLLSAQAEELIRVARSSGIASEAIKGLMGEQAKGLAGNLAAGLKGMKERRDTAASDAGSAAERRMRASLADSGLSAEEIDARARQAGTRAANQAGSGAGLVSQGAATGIGAAIFADFEQLKASGMSTREAIETLSPAIQMFREELVASGFEGGAAFDDLNARLAVFSGEVTGPLVEGITGFSGALANMSNLGILTQESFAGITAQIGANIEALAREGVEGPAAIAALQPQLQTIWELQQKHGFAVDASTQGLIDMGLAGGQIGPEFKTAGEQMADSMERVADAVEALARGLVGVGKAARDAGAAIGSMPPPPSGGGGSGGGGEDPEEGRASGSPGGIPEYWGSGTPVELHGWEAVYTPAMLDRLVGSAAVAGASMVSSGGSRGGDASMAIVERLDRIARQLADNSARVEGAIRDGMLLSRES